MKQNTTSLTLEPKQLKQGAHIVRALNHPLRQAILRLLNKHERLAVKEIYHKLKQGQSETSQHLGVLRQANLVSSKREGQRIFYSVNYRRVHRVQNLAGRLIR